MYVKLVHRNSLMLNESVGFLLCLPLRCCLPDGVHYCEKVKETVLSGVFVMFMLEAFSAGN